jgi:hypothetical protein
MCSLAELHSKQPDNGEFKMTFPCTKTVLYLNGIQLPGLEPTIEDSVASTPQQCWNEGIIIGTSILGIYKSSSYIAECINSYLNSANNTNSLQSDHSLIASLATANAINYNLDVSDQNSGDTHSVNEFGTQFVGINITSIDNENL